MQCEALTQQTAKEHLYGHGRLTSISEAIPSIGEYSAARTTGPDAKRYYIVTFTAPGISPRPKAIYLRGTNRQFASSPTRLEISRTYGFCYAYENERYVGINNIDTFHLLEE